MKTFNDSIALGVQAGGVDFVDAKYLAGFFEKCGPKISAWVGN